MGFSSSARLPPACSLPTRLPRRHRGRDILWWLDRLGVLSQGADAVHDIERSRNQPSLQLVGRPDDSSLDLGVVHDRGVRLVGRVRDIKGHRVGLADDFVATTAAVDFKMAEILMRIDQFIATTGAARPPSRSTQHGPLLPTRPTASI